MVIFLSIGQFEPTFTSEVASPDDMLHAVATKAFLYLFAAAIWTTLLCVINERWQRRCERKARLEHGCSAPKTLPLSGKSLGVAKLRASAARIKEGSYLELCRQRFTSVGTHTYTSSAFGRTTIDTADPTNVRTILSTKFKDWSLGEDRTSAFAPLLGNGIFAADGHQWRLSRTALRPSFTNDHQAWTELLEDRFQIMLTIINCQEGTLDLSELFGCFTLDCATEMFFGKSYNTLEMHRQRCNNEFDSGIFADTSTKHFAEAFSRCQRTMADNLVLGKLGPFLTGVTARKKFDKDCRTVNRFVKEAIDHALASRETPQSRVAKSTFLHSLLKDDQDPADVRSALINILVAGRDTTASLLSNLWFVLARRPCIYQKLADEVRNTLGRDSAVVPSSHDLHRMPYLQACIQEALRLYAPVPLNSRTAVRDTILPTGGGETGQEPLFVSLGTRVAYNIDAMHRRKDIWGPRADEFDPERWINDDGSMLQPGWEYLPFSGGPRVCIGQKLALTQVNFVTCRLVQHFQAVQAEADYAAKRGSMASGSEKSTVAQSKAEAPAASWRWKEHLTLTCTSATGTHVTLLK